VVDERAVRVKLERLPRRCQSSTVTILVFDDYKRVEPRLVPTRMTIRAGTAVRTFVATSVTDDPLPEARFELPDAVKALLPARG